MFCNSSISIERDVGARAALDSEEVLGGPASAGVDADECNTAAAVEGSGGDAACAAEVVVASNVAPPAAPVVPDQSSRSRFRIHLLRT